MQPSTDGVEDEDGAPFLALRGMDRRQDQVVLVQHRVGGFAACRLRRIERELGEKPPAGGIALGDVHELDEVGLARLGIRVDALQMRLVPAGDKAELGRPTGLASVQHIDQRPEVSPGTACSGRCRHVAQIGQRVRPIAQSIKHPSGRGRPDAGKKLQQAEARDLVSRVPDQIRQHC